VTEQRQTQEALRQSETLFRDMADHAPAIVWITGPEGSCTFLSETWYEFTGQSQKAGLGSGWLSAIHRDDREPMLALCALAKARREAYRLEYRLQHVSGDYRRVLVVATPRFGANWEFIGYIGSVLDITEHKRANEEARNTAERLQLAMRATKLGTWDYFPTTGSLIWDERCKALFGLPPDATVDYDMFLAGLHPDDRERTDEMVKRALDPSGDGAIDIEYRTIGLFDQIERWVHATGRTFFRDGVPVRFVGTVQEITDHKRADEAVQRLASIVESSEDAIISKDLNGIIVSWNRGAELIFGYQADEVLGKPITMLIPPDRYDEEPGILRRIRQGQRVDHYETVRRRKDGVLIDVSLTVSPLKDPKGRIIGASKIARDITERKRRERDLQEAKDAAEAANRSKGKFLAVLSHELRTPLTPVLMTVAVREKDPNLPPALRADMAMIRRNVELETKLIDDLLDLSRITSGKLNLRPEPVDLNAMVRQAWDMCRSQIQEKGIRRFIFSSNRVQERASSKTGS
jgi:PAS domain S-box-containing protein